MSFSTRLVRIAIGAFSALLVLLTAALPLSAAHADNDWNEKIAVYRFYNPNSGEHFYSISDDEAEQLSSVGWNYEGIAWRAQGEMPIYRLYNANGGEHHYTLSDVERDYLTSVGWSYEGVSWNTASKTSLPVFRVYNPNAFANNHHYTPNVEEKDYLISIGWRDEGISWYGSEVMPDDEEIGYVGDNGYEKTIIDEMILKPDCVVYSPSEILMTDASSFLVVSRSGVEHAMPVAGGTIIVTDDYLHGKTYSVNSVEELLDGTLKIVTGSQPGLEEVFEKLDVEGRIIFGRNNATTFADGVTLRNDESRIADGKLVAQSIDGSFKDRHNMFLELSKSYGDQIGDGPEAYGNIRLDVYIEIQYCFEVDERGPRIKLIPIVDYEMDGSIGVQNELTYMLMGLDQGIVHCGVYYYITGTGELALDCNVYSDVGIDTGYGKDEWLVGNATLDYTAHEFHADVETGLRPSVGIDFIGNGFNLEAPAGIHFGFSEVRRQPGVVCTDAAVYLVVKMKSDIESKFLESMKLDGGEERLLIGSSDEHPMLGSVEYREHKEDGEPVETCTWDRFPYETDESGNGIIIGCGVEDAVVIIPSQLHGHPITSVGNTAFRWNDTAERIVMQYPMKSLGFASFMGCRKLEDVYLPDSVEFIDKLAFGSCGELTSVRFPQNDYCYLGPGAFRSDSGITSFTLSSNIVSSWYGPFDGAGIKNVYIEGDVKRVPPGIFSGLDKLEYVEVPDQVTTIDTCAFAGCRSLKSVSIGESVNIIELDAFLNCDNLEEVHFASDKIDINEYAFDDYNGTFYCRRGSGADVYAQRHGINVSYTDVEEGTGYQAARISS